MKLIECYIENFGKLSSFSHSFTDGLNVINADNGYGKTTLSVFIKAMLYGIDYKKQKGEETDRKRYSPWQGGRYGGSLTFENEGKKYRIERTFGDRASQDTFAIYDTLTGAASADFTEKVGEELFEVDADGFERTVFLSEKNLSVKGNSTISTKLSNLVGVNGDMGNYSEAMATLEKREKTYRHRRGKGGLIGDLKDEISSVEARLYDIERKKEEYDKAETELTLLAKETEKAEAEIKAIEKSRLSTEYAKEYASRLKALSECEENLEKEKAFFKSSIPRREELKHYEEKRNRAAVLLQSISEEKKALGENFVDNSEEIERFIKAISTPKTPQKANKSYNFALILSFSSLAIGILLGAILTPVLFAVCAFFPVFLAVYFSKKKSSSKPVQTRDITDDAVEFVLSKTGKIVEKSDLYSHLLGMKADILARKRELDRIRASVLQKEETSAELTKEYTFFLSSFETVTDDPFSEILSHLISYESLVSESSRKRRNAEQYAAEHDISEVCAESIPTELSAAHLFSEEALQETEAKAKELQSAKISMESRLSLLYDEISREDELKERILELTDALGNAEFEHKISVKAAEHLTLAKERLTSKYLGKMRSAFDTFADSVCRESGAAFALDTDFALKKTENGLTNSSESYSLGTRELYALITRLALVEALYEKSAPFIILDDPFCHFDDAKCTLALDAITKLSKDKQIIYFTCATSRTPS